MSAFNTSKFIEDVGQYLSLQREIKRDYSPYKYSMKVKLEQSIQNQIKSFKAQKSQTELKLKKA